MLMTFKTQKNISNQYVKITKMASIFDHSLSAQLFLGVSAAP